MLRRLLGDRLWNDPETPAILRKILSGSPIQIIDIGARGGLHERWRPFAELIDAIGFEPDPAECDRLTAAGRGTWRIRFLPYALGGSRARRAFYICREPRCSSLLPPNEAFVSKFSEPIVRSMTLDRETSLDVVALDDVTRDEALHPDCLKIDVQGAELEVLRGGCRTIADAKLVELEVEFNPQYLGQPLFGEVDSYMRTQGFALLGLRRTLWRRRAAIATGGSVAGGQIVHGDVLYYNERALAAAGPDAIELAKWLVLLGAYRQHDFVLTLLADHPAAPGLSDADRDAIRRCLVTRPRPAPRTFSAVLGLMGSVNHHVLRQWLDAMRPGPAEDWHDPDYF